MLKNILLRPPSPTDCFAIAFPVTAFSFSAAFPSMKARLGAGVGG
jgi:hypothetical protein